LYLGGPQTGTSTYGTTPRNVATAATIEEHALLRDQLWFGLQKWLKDGGAIRSDQKLEAE